MVERVRFFLIWMPFCSSIKGGNLNRNEELPHIIPSTVATKLSTVLLLAVLSEVQEGEPSSSARLLSLFPCHSSFLFYFLLSSLFFFFFTVSGKNYREWPENIIGKYNNRKVTCRWVFLEKEISVSAKHHPRMRHFQRFYEVVWNYVRLRCQK